MLGSSCQSFGQQEAASAAGSLFKQASSSGTLRALKESGDHLHKGNLE